MSVQSIYFTFNSENYFLTDNLTANKKGYLENKFSRYPFHSNYLNTSALREYSTS